MFLSYGDNHPALRDPGHLARAEMQPTLDPRGSPKVLKKSSSPTIKVSKDTVLASLNQKFLDLAERGFLDEETIKSVLHSNAATVEKHFASMESLPPPSDKNLHQEIFSDLSVDDMEPPRRQSEIRFDHARSVSPKRKVTIQREMLETSAEVQSEHALSRENQRSQNGTSSTSLPIDDKEAAGKSAGKEVAVVRGRPAERQHRFEPRASKQSINTSSSAKLSSDPPIPLAGMEKAQLRLLLPDNRRSRSEERSSWYASLRSS